jgi:hypothetical protein
VSLLAVMEFVYSSRPYARVRKAAPLPEESSLRFPVFFATALSSLSEEDDAAADIAGLIVQQIQHRAAVAPVTSVSFPSSTIVFRKSRRLFRLVLLLLRFVLAPQPSVAELTVAVDACVLHRAIQASADDDLPPTTATSLPTVPTGHKQGKGCTGRWKASTAVTRR